MRTLVVARQPRQLLLAALVLAVLTAVSVAVMSSVFIAPRLSLCRGRFPPCCQTSRLLLAAIRRQHLHQPAMKA